MPRNSFMVGVEMPRNTPSAVTATGPVAAQACAAESIIREQKIAINNCRFCFRDFSEDMMTLLSHCPDLGGGHYSSNQAGKYTRGKVNLPDSKFFDPFNIYGDTIHLRRLRVIAGETLQDVKPSARIQSRARRMSMSRSTYSHSSVLRRIRTNSSKASECCGAYSNHVRKSKGSPISRL